MVVLFNLPAFSTVYISFLYTLVFASTLRVSRKRPRVRWEYFTFSLLSFVGVSTYYSPHLFICFTKFDLGMDNLWSMYCLSFEPFTKAENSSKVSVEQNTVDRLRLGLHSANR